MAYIDGVVAAVPAANKEAYLEHAQEVSAMFKEFGVIRQVICWGDDIPIGQTTDFRMAVKAKDDEVVTFCWLEWPSKEARDVGMKAMMADPRAKAMTTPFDGKRMIFGGFKPILDV